MNATSRPEHEPWIGQSYRTSPIRLLLLGKAHYGVLESEDSSQFTHQLLSRIRSGAVQEPFFTKTAKLIAAASGAFAATSAFWDQVAFANYIPQTVGSGVHDA